MHAKLLNQARLSVAFAPRGPMLVKSGVESADPTRPGMEFVRTRHARVGETIYLPGTSLKGALRSHAERLLKGVGRTVCDPLDRYGACRPPRGGDKRRTEEPTPVAYKRQCDACRTFGSLSLAGRCSVGDAYPWPPDADGDAMRAAASAANATEQRWQVGIDRRNGSTHRGTLFDLEVAVTGQFHADLRLHNFQLWQLGLVAAVLADVDAGDVPLGFGKSRGLGQVAVSYGRFECEWVDRQPDQRLRGAGALASESERVAYGLAGDDVLDLPAGTRAEPTWRGQRLALGGDAVRALLDGAVNGPLAARAAAAGH